MYESHTTSLFLYFCFFFKQKTAYEMLRSLVGSEMCIRDRVKRLETIDGPSLRTSLFANSIYTVDDDVLGPYSGPCVGRRIQFCSCNNGGRILQMRTYDAQRKIVQIPNTLYLSLIHI
eukprot:TRINITY_DN42199_c0_g1_i1.p1 TRINITY_DN42199_c0_g1~~TRINITY_DN42199_c0_g1_i1.p1  ORF type:complete len:118 (+),score=10.73 TRINITY_DN42199_c0_g1_i1:68-421(+)